MTSLVGMAVRNVVALQYGFVSCTFCRNLYFVKLFSKLEDEGSFTPSRYAIFPLSFAIHNCAWRFNSSCAASNIRVALQVFAWRFKSSCGAPSHFSSLWQHRFQSCDDQRTYDSLINILLENLSHDRKEYDHAVYKLEHVIQIGVRSEVQGLWQRTFLNEFLNDLIVAYSKLLEDESQPIDGTRQPSVVYTGAAGRPSIDIPRQTLKMYLNFGFSLKCY